MLISFAAENFKSFGDRLQFSLEKAPRLTELGYSVVEKRFGSKKKKILCSSVIYGPNAAGKSNIIGAVEVFKQIVLRGHVRNSDPQGIEAASSRLELIPNASRENQPVSFSILFEEQDILFSYSCAFDCGEFLSRSHRRTILTEELKIQDKLIFFRDGMTLEFGSLTVLKNLQFLSLDITENIKDVAKASLAEDEFFLENGFKTIISQKLMQVFNRFLNEKLIVIPRANCLYYVPKRSAELMTPRSIAIDDTINTAARLFGVTASSLGFLADSEGNEELVSLIKTQGKTLTIPAELFESYGTVRFANLFPLLLGALRTGQTLVIDEFDASIHPVALMSIISLFHNDEINRHHAQLIFNTHNPIFLNRNIFRRDEITLVERNSETDFSECYRLSDFGTAGKQAVTLSDNYMEKYMDCHYGAICEVDFSELFGQILHEQDPD